MSMSKTMPAPASNFAPPQIDASDLKAVRDFLTSIRDEQSPSSSTSPSSASTPSPRLFNRPGDRKSPAVSNGITRARLRSSKAGV